MKGAYIRKTMCFSRWNIRKRKVFMQEILYAIKEDILELKAVMEEAVQALPQKDWYVADDIDFLKRHIKEDGYILKCVIEGKIVAFLIVRYPMFSEDNLGQYLPQVTKEMLQKVAHIESVAVLPKFRGHQLQKRLLEMAEMIEKEKNTIYFMATVHPDNIYSSRNFKEQGYRCLLETRKYGGLKRVILLKELVPSNRDD